MAPVWEKVLKTSRTKPEGLKLNDLGTLAAAKALIGLFNNDAQSAHEAVDLVRGYLPTATFDISIQDVSRQIGALMLNSAMVYDWCYPLLSREDKGLFVTHMERLAGTLETGYPPIRGGAITGHAGEAMLMRDTLSAGIAIYNEKPEMYRLAINRIFAEFIPARDFFYPSAMHHQGNAYGPYRYSWEIQCAWILKRMTGEDYFSREQGQQPYHWIYSRRPDGLQIPDGDMFRGMSLAAVNMLTASYYNDRLLQSEYLSARDVDRVPPIERILFWDPALEPQPANLPLARFFGFPLSSIIARTGWDENAAIVEMKMTDYQFNNHHHLDGGAFQIYYRGALAIDSGVYGPYGSDHDSNYLKRTIAHNSMLVYDPDEQFRRGALVNDGGQRWPANGSEPRDLNALLSNGYKVATTTGRHVSEDFSFLEGDLSQAYTSKIKTYKRGFVFLNLHDSSRPAALVVYDRVVSSSPAFKKSWLLHSIVEPEVTAGITVIRQKRAKLVNQTIAPLDYRIVKVGGPGHEFDVNGANHAPSKPVKPEDEAGSWRIELSSAKPSAETKFINVMQVMDAESVPLPVVPIEAGPLNGVRIGDRIVLFNVNAARVASSVNFDAAAGAKVVVTGIEPGQWHVRQNGRDTVRTAASVLEFDASGHVTLSK